MLIEAFVDFVNYVVDVAKALKEPSKAVESEKPEE
jgi:hypothetical protein